MPRRKAEGRSDHILDSALRLFAQHGYAKSTIADVAKAAKVATGTIYLYYKSKEEILGACALRFHKEHQAFSHSLLESKKSPEVKLRDYLVNRYQLWKQETTGSVVGSDMLQAMLSAAPEINQSEHKLWMDTLKGILSQAEEDKIYYFESLTKELKIFLHCMIGFFPLPGVEHPFAPSKRDLLTTLEWFDKKWRQNV